MSLLIKALYKAENDKAENDKVAENDRAVNEGLEHSNFIKQTEKSNAKGRAGKDLALSLSPTNSPLAQPNSADKTNSANKISTANISSTANIPSTANKPNTANKFSASAAAQSSSALAPSLVSPTAPASSASLKSAANMFSAKSVGVSNQNTSLALIAGAGLVALLAMGIYFYQFVDNTPQDVTAPQALQQLATTPQAEVSPALPLQTSQVQVAETPAPLVVAADEEVSPPVKKQETPIKQIANKQAISRDEELAVSENERVIDETVVVTKVNKKVGKSKSLQFSEAIASPSASIEVTRTKSAAGVNPTLMSAYEAYTAGDDANAQKLYKQALQRDVRNVDALLGLGAIASRQGRDADANGWYGKVLELDPRNSMAQAALLQSSLQINQAQGNEANNESRIKNMLAKQPDNANLHAALGNLYAEQNQWPAAQQAYFDAYSLTGSADNAFNLAVSLDQMGKPKLALPYYQRALEQASDTSGIDKVALEARIGAIQ